MSVFSSLSHWKAFVTRAEQGKKGGKGKSTIGPLFSFLSILFYPTPYRAYLSCPARPKQPLQASIPRPPTCPLALWQAAVFILTPFSLSSCPPFFLFFSISSCPLVEFILFIFFLLFFFSSSSLPHLLTPFQAFREPPPFALDLRLLRPSPHAHPLSRVSAFAINRPFKSQHQKKKTRRQNIKPRSSRSAASPPPCRFFPRSQGSHKQHQYHSDLPHHTPHTHNHTRSLLQTPGPTAQDGSESRLVFRSAMSLLLLYCYSSIALLPLLCYMPVPPLAFPPPIMPMPLPGLPQVAILPKGLRPPILPCRPLPQLVCRPPSWRCPLDRCLRSTLAPLPV